jgi:hypothetical protein
MELNVFRVVLSNQNDYLIESNAEDVTDFYTILVERCLIFGPATAVMLHFKDAEPMYLNLMNIETVQKVSNKAIYPNTRVWRFCAA